MTGYILIIIISATGTSSVGWLFIPAAFIMSAVGVLNVIITVFLANTVDYGEFKNSRRDESVIFSMQTFVVKLASGIAGFISSMVLFVFHISSNKEAVVTEPIAASSRMGLRLSMTIIPIVVLVIGFIVFKKRYILTDRKLAEISKELEKKTSELKEEKIMIQTANDIFVLHTEHTTYAFRKLPTGQLEHLYYGRKIHVCEPLDENAVAPLIENIPFSPATAVSTTGNMTPIR